MTIDLSKEIKEITPAIKTADDYLSCEKVIISNIKKHFNNNTGITVIESYLKQLLMHFEDIIKKSRDAADCINYRYAAGFLNVLLQSTYWHSWIKGHHQ